MAVYQTIELNNAHQWLPPEILQDIGIFEADHLDHTIIEELASRLARILNTSMERYQHHHLHHARAKDSYRQQHPPQPQVYRLERWVHVANGRDNANTMKTSRLLCNGRIMEEAINLPRFALAKQQLTVLQPAKQSNRGTGVFLPRTEAYNQMTRQTKTPRTSTPELKPHYNRQQCQQKHLQKLHIHVNASVATNEQKEHKTKEANAASHDCTDEHGLPHEWIY